MKNIFLVLSEELVTVEIDGTPTEILVGPRKFERVDNHDFHGFYDWLRHDDLRIIGVRYFVFADYQFMINAIRDLNYVIAGQEDGVGVELIIYFGDEKSFEPEISCDQMFTGDYFFRSSDDTYGISLEMPDEPRKVA